MTCAMIILNYLDKERALKLAQLCSTFLTINHIVIVDNCSPDDSYSYLKKHENDKIKVILSPKNGGFSYGNNVGAKFVANNYNVDYILFANTDTIFKEENVISCMNLLKSNPEIGLVSTRMKNINGEEEISCWKHKNYWQMVLFCLKLYRTFNYKKFYYDLTNTNNEYLYVDVVRGSFMLFNAKTLQQIDYFDDNTFLYYEEDIISRRLISSGYKIAILINYFYIHDHIELKTSNTLSTKSRLDNSMYYYLNHYYKISKVQKLFAIIIISYSRVEEQLVMCLKNLIYKGENK